MIRRAKEQIEKQDLIEQARNYAKQIAEAAYKEAEGIIEEAKQARHQMMVETFSALDSVYSQAFKDVTTEASNTKEYLSESAQNIDISRQKMHADLERITKQYSGNE